MYTGRMATLNRCRANNRNTKMIDSEDDETTSWASLPNCARDSESNRPNHPNRQQVPLQVLYCFHIADNRLHTTLVTRVKKRFRKVPMLSQL
ncbi:hypothetical protein AVEN_269742-1 [Araneus ventricosus]|uniref:Uncharacterized protein n=1 Tax=Araneus ventricosus TaxID=182803 RepID=A0A4Y2EI80_ARAVE|nr:hypothetical protein AVEN_269742-1 [Araneus ventricosus]